MNKTSTLCQHSVRPGLILDSVLGSTATGETLEQRLVTLQEVGQLAAASDAASGMTGQTIYIDAGYHVAG